MLKKKKNRNSRRSFSTSCAMFCLITGCLSVIPATLYAAAADNSGIVANIGQNADMDTESLAEANLLPELAVGAIYSTVYSAMAHIQYANFLTPRDAAAILMDYGPDQFRMDLTWAHILTANQRFKLSAQHFSQRNDFTFATPSPGGVYIGQNAVGGEYEYAFGHSWLQVLNLQGYYFSASNGDLVDILFSPDGTHLFNDQRTLVGGQGGGFSVGPRWQIWRGGEFGVAVNYDEVNFDTQVPGVNNQSQGLGGTAHFRQQLAANLDIEFMATLRQPYDQYTAEINWIVHQSATHRFGLQLTASHLNSDVLPAGNENVVGLSLIYRWDGRTRISRQQPQCFVDDAGCDLIHWTTHSAAYTPGVYLLNAETIVPQ